MIDVSEVIAALHAQGEQAFATKGMGDLYTLYAGPAFIGDNGDIRYPVEAGPALMIRHVIRDIEGTSYYVNNVVAHDTNDVIHLARQALADMRQRVTTDLQEWSEM